jgi:hypothetical protein
MKIDPQLKGNWTTAVLHPNELQRDQNKTSLQDHHVNIGVLLAPFYNNEAREDFFSFVNSLKSEAVGRSFRLRYDGTDDEDPSVVGESFVPSLQRRTLLVVQLDRRDRAAVDKEANALVTQLAARREVIWIEPASEPMYVTSFILISLFVDYRMHLPTRILTSFSVLICA